MTRTNPDLAVASQKRHYTLHMNRHVIMFGITVELLISFLLYGLAPTDGLRVWYPSVWAYMGEHALIWGILVAFLFVVLRNTHVGEALTALTCLVAELFATLFIWFVIPREGETSRAWYTGRFTDYFKARLITWCVLAVFASLIYWIRYKRAAQRIQAHG